MNVVLISVGDARASGTWSGVPKRVYEELRRRGHNVVPADITKDFLWHWCGAVFNRIVRSVYCPWKRVAFCNTRLGLFLSRRFLRRTLNRCSHIDLIFATTFSIDCSTIDIPCILLHDWTEGYAILRTGSRMNSCELRSESNQLKVIKSAQMSIAIYPESCNYLKGLLGPKNQHKICYVCNPINTDSLSNQWINDRLHEGVNSRRVLVVGGFWYQRNVECVIKAADLLGYDDVVVDVIGRTCAEAKPKHCKVNFYGYLNKDIPEQKATYMELFKKARCLVNVKKTWGGGSSVAEAMYDYIPIIVGRYPEFVSMYGEEGFGYYCREEDISALSELLRRIFALDESSYVQLCKSAHALVENDTYERLMTVVLKGVSKNREDTIS